MEIIDTKRAAELVEGTDRLSRCEIEKLANERLRFLIDYARKNSKYLAKKYAELPEDFSLADIPIATRSEMVENFEEWVCDTDITNAAVSEYLSDFENIYTRFLGKYALASTSGTTAAPLRIVRDARHLAIHGALMDKRYFHGPLLKDVEGIDKPDMKNCGIIPDGGFHSSYVSFLRMRRSYEERGMEDKVKFIPVVTPIEKMVQELNDFQPEMIGTYPSVIYTLASEQKAGRLNIHPKFIGCSAEKLTDESRKYISEAFGCPVNDNYCSTEGGEVAMLCPNGHLHLNSDWIIVEPVDKDMKRVPSGVRSDGILITNLACLVQPVIRYHMSDKIIMFDEPCGCGLNTPYIDIGGRSEEVLEFEKDGKTSKIAGLQLYFAASHTEGCGNCQFIQRGKDSLEVRVEVLSGYDNDFIVSEVMRKTREILDGSGLGYVSADYVQGQLIRTKGGKIRLAFKEF